MAWELMQINEIAYFKSRFSGLMLNFIKTESYFRSD